MSELENFSKQVSAQLDGNLLPFWCGPAVDGEKGGWMGWLSNDLKPDRTRPKGLILNARILWTFSAVHRVRPDPLYRQMAGRALDYVLNRFWDAQYGGAYWQLDDDGRVRDDSKKIYGQAFCIYALAEYHRAFGSAGALERAIQLFGLVDEHAHDQLEGGYFEVCRRDWSVGAADARLSERDMSEKKSMNNHLHILEACTNLYRAWPAPRLQQRLQELIRLFDQRILDGATLHLRHFFNEHWEVRSDTYTFGHDIEATWLLDEAAEALGDVALSRRVNALALRMAEVVLREGLDVDGALRYEGREGKIIDAGKEWWPQAEAVIGFLNAYQISGERKFLVAARNAWEFISQKLVDPAHGDWFWRITPEGHVDPARPKVSEWKGPYHSVRMCLETLRRLELLAKPKRTEKT